jgi:hypothetical protein
MRAERKTVNTPTPETDNITINGIGSEYSRLADHARRLEQERDHLRKLAEQLESVLRLCDGRCNSMHHSPKDYNHPATDCPVEKKYRSALTAYSEYFNGQ